MRKWEHEKMRKFGNEKIGIVSLFNFGKVLNFAKVWDKKAMYWGG